MKISEIIQSTPEEILSKIGMGPFLYYDTADEIIIDGSLDRILSMYVKDGKIISDIDIYTYGFKKDDADAHQYVPAEDLKRRFEEMEKNDSFEYIEMVEEEGRTLFVPSYCGFDELVYFYENGDDIVVNCKPLKVAIEEEVQKRIDKSDMIRK